MKKAVIQVRYEEEKLNAVKQYMARKEANLDDELEDTMQKLYEKYVPQAVRDYIESRIPEEKNRPARRGSVESSSRAETGNQGEEA